MTTLLELQHFAVLEVSYLHKLTSIVVSCDTNNPCHLTLYYTEKEPVRHATSLVKRGLAVPWGAYFCFVAWNSVEQQEAGDTLIHTFEVPDWSYCQTKWFTFRGTVTEALSPSVTALLKHHHPGIPTVKTFIARTSDGYLDTGIWIRDYILSHDGTKAYAYDTDDWWSVGQQLTQDWYIVYRAGLFFDTSEIPAGAKILSATLSYYVKNKFGWDYDIVIVSGEDLSEPLQPHHYHDLLDDTQSLGSAPAEDSYRFQHIPLNEIGLLHINTTGLTKLALRTNEDIDYIPPTLWHFQRGYSAEYRTKPYLTVTYQKA
ncbi:hypothetical protein ES708_13928 [subsurface metagenome]